MKKPMPFPSSMFCFLQLCPSKKSWTEKKKVCTARNACWNSRRHVQCRQEVELGCSTAAKTVLLESWGQNHFASNSFQFQEHAVNHQKPVSSLLLLLQGVTKHHTSKLQCPDLKLCNSKKLHFHGRKWMFFSSFSLFLIHQFWWMTLQHKCSEWIGASPWCCRRCLWQQPWMQQQHCIVLGELAGCHHDVFSNMPWLCGRITCCHSTRETTNDWQNFNETECKTWKSWMSNSAIGFDWVWRWPMNGFSKTEGPFWRTQTFTCGTIRIQQKDIFKVGSVFQRHATVVNCKQTVCSSCSMMRISPHKEMKCSQCSPQTSLHKGHGDRMPVWCHSFANITSSDHTRAERNHIAGQKSLWIIVREKHSLWEKRKEFWAPPPILRRSGTSLLLSICNFNPFCINQRHSMVQWRLFVSCCSMDVLHCWNRLRMEANMWGCLWNPAETAACFSWRCMMQMQGKKFSAWSNMWITSPPAYLEKTSMCNDQHHNWSWQTLMMNAVALHPVTNTMSQWLLWSHISMCFDHSSIVDFSNLKILAHRHTSIHWWHKVCQWKHFMKEGVMVALFFLLCWCVLATLLISLSWKPDAATIQHEVPCSCTKGKVVEDKRKRCLLFWCNKFRV